MTDITQVTSSLLVSLHSTGPIKKHVHTPERLDAFIQEAYRINGHISALIAYLRQIRPSYLSTAAPPPPSRLRSYNKSSSSSSSSTVYLNDAQRIEIDSQTSTLLHDLSSNVSALAAAENLRTSTETALLERRFGKSRGGGNSILWRWAAGDGEDDEDASAALGKSAAQIEAEGRAYGVKVCREGVLWYLGWRLQHTVELQRGMVEVRAAREREKEKSVLWKMAAAGNNVQVKGGVGGQIPRRVAGDTQRGESDYSATHFDPHSHLRQEGQQDEQEAKAAAAAAAASNRVQDNNDDELPPQLRQLFESENSSLLQHYETTLSKVQAAEKSLLEISSLQQTLVGHLSTQGEMIEQLVQDATGTGENVRKGNRELKRAGERWGKGLARGVFWGTVGLCGFCVVWDLVF